MKIKNKNYPHPIIADGYDDISDSSIKCNVDIDWDKSYYYLKYDLNLEHKTVTELIRNEQSHFIIHVECGKTFFRKAYKIDAANFSDNNCSGILTIPASKLKDRTEVSIFVCSATEISNYIPAGMHSDYGNNSFKLENGDVIALWKTYKFDLYQDYDPIKKADSIISFQRDNERETGEIIIDVECDKLTARLPKDIHILYNDLKADKGKEDIIMSILGIPILIEGLLYIKENMAIDEGVNLSGCRRHRWFRSLEKKLDDMHIDIKSEESMFAVAQKVFENPCKKAGLAFERLDEKQY